MKEVILIKNGELALKGLNRSTFEDILIKNIRRRISALGDFKFIKSQSTVLIEPTWNTIDFEETLDRVRRVFGIVRLSRAAACEKDFDIICKTAEEYLSDELEAASTFKVEAKRSDKKFPMDSPAISRELGGYLLSKHPSLTVDVHNPELTVTVEIRDEYAFIHGNQLKGAGGMPTGTGGNAAVLISGGIDSPVAAWMMAKRGLQLTGIHFASPPYTSPRAEMKVHELLSRVARYCGRISLHTVQFTEIQEAIRDNCPEDCFTVIMRRMMMRVSNRIAEKNGCGALITGESLGQVASQTLYALQCTDSLAQMPVFRPCIGMDKTEIIDISRKIDTFDISIQPYEDCCTVFTPKHPKTRPTNEYMQEVEKALDIETLVSHAVDSATLKVII